MPGKLLKSLFSFLFFCLLQSAYSMENEGFFTHMYNQFNHSLTFYNSFCRVVELAEKNNFSPQDCEIIKAYIRNRADPNWKIGKDKETLLNLAVRYQKKDLLDFLLQHNADINASNKEKLTPLHVLVHLLANNNHKKFDIHIEDLVKYGANINAKDNDGATPLHTAVLLCNIDHIKSLIQHGADINAEYSHIGMTPLVLALCNNQTPEVIKELCKLKASLTSIYTGNNSNIFHVLVDCGDEAIKYFKPLITYARFDDFDKGSKQTVPFALWMLEHWETNNGIKFPKDIKLRILSKFPLSDLYPYKKLCEELLLKKNYKNILLPDIYKRVKHIQQILTTRNTDNQTALEYALEKFADNLEYILNARSFLDATLLENDFQNFLAYFPDIVSTELKKDKENLVCQMFDNCAQLFLEK